MPGGAGWGAGWLVDFAFEGAVQVEQLQAALPLDLTHKPFELIAASEDFVEFVVTEAYEAVVFNRAAVVNLVDIRPHAGAEAHMARLSGRVEGAARQVESLQTASCLPDGFNLAVGCRVVVQKHPVVPRGYDLSILDNDRSERPSVVIHNPFRSLVNRHLHIFPVHL